MRDYTPQVGSLVDRLLRHLVQAGVGKDFTAAELEAATGVHNRSIQASLLSPIRRGFVTQTKRTGPPARFAWGITADGMAALCGEPEPAANGGDADNTDEDPAVDALEQDPAAPQLVPGRAADPPEQAAFACALYSNGRFHIKTTGGDTVTLQRDETRQLLAYLDLLRIGDFAVVAEDPAPRPPAQ